MNAKQRRAHIRELTALYKDTVPSEFNAELVSELIDAGKDIKLKNIKIEALRAENESLKQQVEQGKQDAMPEGWISIKDRLPEDKDTCDGRVAALDEDGVAMIGLAFCKSILTSNGRATRWMPLPAAPKQEK